MSPNSVSSVVRAVQSTSLGIPFSYQRTATRTNLNPPPDKEGSSGMEEVACCSGRAAVWRNPRAYVAHRRNFVGQ